MIDRARPQPAAAGDYGEAFPNSRKVYVEGRRGVRVPMREIALSGGEPPLRVYDTSGPLGADVRQGLPPLRAEWIRARGGVETVERSYAPPPGGRAAEIPETLRRPTLRGTGCVTQMHYARRGEVTPEMEFAALREGVDPEMVRSEIARGRAILPANLNHPELEPMLIGRAFR
ncbi:MAG TPA: phosphomethylpyrimidine synthase ThiC, partial [Longimicrobiaceae bacterium]|nr:phosphomethylpyrimidine synthase ThiC [Longimicrobiaceae bacterium]